MNCLLCNNLTTENNNYYFCDCCEFIFKNRNNVLSEQEEKARYCLHNNNLDDEYVKYFKNIAEVAVVPYVEGKNGLDYGSGACNVFEEVLEKYFNFNIDSYDKYFYDVNLKVKYDFITCIEVIEHIDKPSSFFKELDELLCTDGHLIFKTNFHKNNADLFFNWWYIRDDTHISFYTLKTFEYLADTFNYKIVFSNNQSLVVMKKL